MQGPALGDRRHLMAAAAQETPQQEGARPNLPCPVLGVPSPAELSGRALLEVAGEER